MVKWDFRDVSKGIKKIREFLLGREFVFHHRFPPKMAPRSIPKPDVPRGPEYKYAGQWYLNRDVLNSVKPPVVAPVAEGCKLGASPFAKTSTGQVEFPSDLPTPGGVWWWDAHCYYKEIPYQKPCGPPRPDEPTLTLPKSICETPPPTFVPKQESNPCVLQKPEVCAPSTPPCRLDPCKSDSPPPPPPPPPEPCDPCKPPKKC